MDLQSLERLEFSRVTSLVSQRARSVLGVERLSRVGPIADRAVLEAEIHLLHEAIRRQQEPGEWCSVGEGVLGQRISQDERESSEEAGRLDGPGLVEVRTWLEAAEATRDLWGDEATRERFPRLATRVDDLPKPDALREQLSAALDADGRIKDSAGSALARLRRAVAEGEQSIQRQLERWIRGFGDNAYVTRWGERFVAMVPAAGFSRRRGIVHDVSSSGQSLLVEPLEACDANNRLIGAQAAAAEEERRILITLAAAVRFETETLLELENILVHLDTLRARARWAADWGGTAIVPTGDRIKLRGAKHPLLASGPGHDSVVPLDLELGPETRVLLVSGPNMGGKTVLLKTVGLSVALAHSALPVIASEGSQVPELDRVLADLGDEQSLDRGLSTFAAHLERLSEMATAAGPRTLLLCDELGAGTDPEEGAALGRALIERFVKRRAWSVITTHLGSLKRAGAEMAGIESGSLEFDSVHMRPRYRFVVGVPGASYGLAMAERLGLDSEVVARARAITPEETRATERLIAGLEALHQRLEAAREDLERTRVRAEQVAHQNRQKMEQDARELAGARDRLNRQSETMIAQARVLLRDAQRELGREQKSRSSLNALRERMHAVEREHSRVEAEARSVEETWGIKKQPSAPLKAEQVQPGLRVRVAHLGIEAEVVERPDSSGHVTLRRGTWGIRAHLSQLFAIEEATRVRASRTANGSGEELGSRGPVASWEVPEEAPSVEVDLRGMDVEQAIRSLDRGLDRGVLAGLSELRVIHGVGRGVLRSAVDKHLRGHPQVADQRLGEMGEGGVGVTVVKLR